MLTGTALKDRAKELNIQGRSKMSAEELRAAIEKIEAADATEWNDLLDETKEQLAPATAVSVFSWRRTAKEAGTYYRSGSPAKQHSSRGPTLPTGKSLTRAQRKAR